MCVCQGSPLRLCDERKEGRLFSFSSQQLQQSEKPERCVRGVEQQWEHSETPGAVLLGTGRVSCMSEMDPIGFILWTKPLKQSLKNLLLCPTEESKSYHEGQ